MAIDSPSRATVLRPSIRQQKLRSVRIDSTVAPRTNLEDRDERARDQFEPFGNVDLPNRPSQSLALALEQEFPERGEAVFLQAVGALDVRCIHNVAHFRLNRNRLLFVYTISGFFPIRTIQN